MICNASEHLLLYSSFIHFMIFFCLHLTVWNRRKMLYCLHSAVSNLHLSFSFVITILHNLLEQEHVILWCTIHMIRNVKMNKSTLSTVWRLNSRFLHWSHHCSKIGLCCKDWSLQLVMLSMCWLQAHSNLGCNVPGESAGSGDCVSLEWIVVSLPQEKV